MTTLAEQIATLESRLAAYESRKVPLSADDACRIWEDDPDDRIGPSCLAVARAALVAAESPAAVDAAMAAWNSGPVAPALAMLAAIRAAHDAAIDGGCGAARESAGPPWLADAAEALGKRGAALNWSQVISEIRDLRHRLYTAREDVDEVRAERDRWLAEARTNYKDSDNLRRQLDALTQPVDGVEELGRIGFEAWHRFAWPGGDPKQKRSEDSANADERCAQAIASRVIGALRAGLAGMCGGDANPVRHKFAADCVEAFDDVVASLKIEPAKVEQAPKREPFELPHHATSLVTVDENGRAIRDRIREIERRLEAGGL